MAPVESGTREKRLLLSLTAIGFAILFALSWQKWADLAIDSGREMNTPLRLLQGELIYSDVYYLYGPLAPYLNSVLYAVFGVHLNTLYAAGTVASVLVLLLVFHLSARVSGVRAAGLATLTVLVFCIFKRNGNYIFPYTYSAVYGTLLGLAALAAALRYIDGRSRGRGGAEAPPYVHSAHAGAPARGATAPPSIDTAHAHAPQGGAEAPSYVHTAHTDARQEGATAPPYLQPVRWLAIAGVLAGLALVCKLEFGFAATGALVAVALSEPRGVRMSALVRGLGPALLIPLVVYGVLLARMPWETLVKDTYLWPGYIPAELIYFNRTKLGLNAPAKTVRELLSAAAMLGVLVAVVLAAAARLGAGSARAALRTLPRRHRWALIAVAAGSLAVLLMNSLLFRTRWDVSPFRALPVLCAGLIVYGARAGDGTLRSEVQRRSLLVLSVYGLAVLTRVILRVPSGGAYGSYLLPVPLILFTHVGTRFYRPVFARLPASHAHARRIVAVLFTGALIASGVVIAYRYVKTDYAVVRTARGAARVAPDESRAFSAALEFITQSTASGEYICAVPEGSSLNFLAGRPAPLRYEILTPGFLDLEGEQRAVEELRVRQVRFIFLLNRPPGEFGCRAFGRDCYRELMRAIDDRYEVATVFGEGASASSEIGDPVFFIKAYRRKTPALARR